jgi:outer membrane receptor protein involved in Fe transport
MSLAVLPPSSCPLPRRLAVLAFLFLAPFARWVAAQGIRVTGKVTDSSGAPISAAEIELRSASYSARMQSSPAGEFAFDAVPGSSGVLIVRATGFQELRRDWSVAGGHVTHLDIALRPLLLPQRVTVTARTPTPSGESLTGDRQLTSHDLAASPNLMLDDTLRQLPGFSLFRRSSSRTANPTAQGVSLRGLAASGASRALVLEDGIPMNDPFGAWVYWDRIPEQSIASVEVSQEGGSSLYGSDALGGVIEFFTRSPEEQGIALETSYGNQNMPDLSLWAGGTRHGWEGSFAGEVFRTDGYVLVPGSDRGSVDTKAGSQHGSASLMVGRKLANGSDVFVRGSFFNESRENGTPDQVNDTRLGQGAAGADLQLGNFGALTLRSYADAQTYNQTFSSIAADRDSETLTDVQSVPSQGVGGSAVWSRALGKRQTLVAGIDRHEEIGHSNEALPLAGKETSSGGRQRATGIFGEDLIQLTPRWTLAASARFDHWSNFDASMFSAPMSSPESGTTAPYPDHSYNAFSPRLSVVNRVAQHVSWSASIYRAFRAPTLNELYRSFRVGNVVTGSNANLSAERLTGGEAGVSVDAFHQRLLVRGTAFLNEVIDPVANVTLNTTPSLITRQRQNLGRTRAPGVEIDAKAAIARHLWLSGAYQYVDATVTRFPADPTLVGLWVPQVPHHVWTFRASYENPGRISFSIDGRMVGKQFDDDQNQFPLGRFFVLDAMARRDVGRDTELFVAGENLFNARYSTAATPVPQLGLPISIRAGLRVHLGR